MPGYSLNLTTGSSAIQCLSITSSPPKGSRNGSTCYGPNTKVKVRSLDGDTDFFDIVVSVLQGETLVPYLFIIRLDYVLRTSIHKKEDNGFKLAKERNRRYPARTNTDTDYANDIALLANTFTHAETLLHSLECAAAGIGLYVNADKTEYMCFNPRGDISTLDGSSLKLVGELTYLWNSVSSTENNTNTRLAKAWTANDRLCHMEVRPNW